MYRRLFFTICAILAGVILTGCTSVRPVRKVGLIAPFEGIYRQSGYAELAGLRLALETSGDGTPDIVPVALDDGGLPEQAERAAATLAADEAVGAVVGPSSPGRFVAAMPKAADVPWIAPYAVDPITGGFANPQQATAWADGLVHAVAAGASTQGAGRLWLAGLTAGWPSREPAEWSAIADMPVALVAAGGALAPASEDAVLWLGDAVGGVELLTALRRQGYKGPVWLGPEAVGPVFTERVLAASEIGLKNVYWATWRNVEYNSEIVSSQPIPHAHLVYEATRYAIAVVQNASPPSSVSWQVMLYAYMADGSSTRVLQNK